MTEMMFLFNANMIQILLLICIFLIINYTYTYMISRENCSAFKGLFVNTLCMTSLQLLVLISGRAHHTTSVCLMLPTAPFPVKPQQFQLVCRASSTAVEPPPRRRRAV